MSAQSLRVSVFHFRFLKWETIAFISSGLWLRHPDPNTVNYKICLEIHQHVCLIKIRNMNGPTSHGWHGFNNATDEWCKRLECVCVYVKGRLSWYLIWLQILIILHSYIWVLVWRKLQARCYYVEYIAIKHHFLFFTFHKVVWHIVKMRRENDKRFYCKLLAESRGEFFLIDQDLAKLWTNNIVGFFWLKVYNMISYLFGCWLLLH